VSPREELRARHPHVGRALAGAGELKRSPEPKLVFPFDAPAFALNRTTVSMFNAVFFHKQRKAHVKALRDYESFFYPLDAVLHWNRMYGKRG